MTAVLKAVEDLGGMPSVHEECLPEVGYQIDSNDCWVRVFARAKLPTHFGEFNILVFKNSLDEKEHVAIVRGNVHEQMNVPTRVHSECLTGDVFGSMRCDCRDQLEFALNSLGTQDCGVLVYLRQEGRGIGLKNKLLAYQLQDNGLDTVEANEELGYAPDLREYGIGAQIIKECGITKMKLMTNNPKKIIGLEGYGLEVVGRESLDIQPNKNNEKYLKTKKEKLGHFIFGDKKND